jgi:hypothetical protein
MPADLKKVAREIAYKCTEVVEARLQTLVSEVRAQAMLNEADELDRVAGNFEDDAEELWAGRSVAKLYRLRASIIRRRASGKDE